MDEGWILVVDDVPDVRMTLSGILMDEGYRVCTASSRDEALHILQTQRFDVAVLDVRLVDSDIGNRDGLLLMRDIKFCYPTIAIIILTAYADVSMVREVLQPLPGEPSLAFGFLEKSEIDQLLPYVRQACESSKAAATSYVTSLIRQGEGARVEFKASLRWDYRKQDVNRALSEAVAKTIAGMLNSEGGTLLIGVSDNGEILGIERDLQTLEKQNWDGFYLALADLCATRLGLEHISYVHPRFEVIDGKTICMVATDKSPEPVFLDSGGQSEFWVRTGNSTRKLDIKAAIHYIGIHWG